MKGESSYFINNSIKAKYQEKVLKYALNKHLSSIGMGGSAPMLR